ncbi:helix-turn-helix transcriptional regulator [Nocardia brasiliensis]|uniref:helix-turn-helix transcriptional regulator n=1 Tax=Nocardia brasiliensis TaxID=37326 RepID=UPI00245535F1|nr:AraC family transcriptional regulator [Nocardia brasiliensis]
MTIGLLPNVQLHVVERLLTRLYSGAPSEPAGDRLSRIGMRQVLGTDFLRVYAGTLVPRKSSWQRQVAHSSSGVVSGAIPLEGRLSFAQHGTTKSVGPESILFINPMLASECRVDSSVRGIFFLTALGRGPFRSRVTGASSVLTAPLVVPRIGAAAVTADFFRSIASHRLDRPLEAVTIAAHGVELLCSVLDVAAMQPLREEGGDGGCERVLSYLHRNYSDATLTVNSVARSCDLSRSTLYRRTAFYGGVGPLLRHLRVGHARRMLAHQPDTPIADVAAASGFSSIRQFYRAFRAETSMTPGLYRASSAPAYQVSAGAGIERWDG